ncbi:hypothetical protein FI667_g9099, partial [Globisporangium splendens]
MSSTNTNQREEEQVLAAAVTPQDDMVVRSPARHPHHTHQPRSGHTPTKRPGRAMPVVNLHKGHHHHVPPMQHRGGDHHQYQHGEQHQQQDEEYNYEDLPHTKYADDIHITEQHSKYADDILTPGHDSPAGHGGHHRRTGSSTTTTYVVRSPVRSPGQSTTMTTSTVRSGVSSGDNSHAVMQGEGGSSTTTTHVVRSPVVRTHVQTTGSRHATPVKSNMQFVQHGGVQGQQVRADSQDGEVQYYEYETEAQGQAVAGGVIVSGSAVAVEGAVIGGQSGVSTVSSGDNSHAVVHGEGGSSSTTTTYVVRSPVRSPGQSTTMTTSTVRSGVSSGDNSHAVMQGEGGSSTTTTHVVRSPVVRTHVQTTGSRHATPVKSNMQFVQHGGVQGQQVRADSQDGE